MDESRDFDISDFDPEATGTAFQKFSGGFVLYPTFLTSAFRFKWVLEMPEEAYLGLEGKWLYQWATYQDTGSVFPEVTIACYQEIGVENFDLFVNEHDDTFDSTADTDLPLWE